MIETKPTVQQTVKTPEIGMGTVFRQALRENLPGIIAWGVGFSTLIVTVVILYPLLEENDTLLGVLNGLGLVDMVARNYPVDVNALASFPGYLAFEALGWAPTLFSIYLVPQAINAILGEEKRGTLFLLLSTPITRTQLFIEKILAIAISFGLILLIAWTSLVVSVQLVPGVELSIAQAMSGIWHIIPITSVILALTMLLSVTLRGGRTVGGIVALFIISSYFLRSIADATGSELLQQVRYFSIYNYYSSIGALIDGIRWGNDLGLLACSIILFSIALYRFQKRDLWR